MFRVRIDVLLSGGVGKLIDEQGAWRIDYARAVLPSAGYMDMGRTKAPLGLVTGREREKKRKV